MGFACDAVDCPWDGPPALPGGSPAVGPEDEAGDLDGGSPLVVCVCFISSALLVRGRRPGRAPGTDDAWLSPEVSFTVVLLAAARVARKLPDGRGSPHI